MFAPLAVPCTRKSLQSFQTTLKLDSRRPQSPAAPSKATQRVLETEGADRSAHHCRNVAISSSTPTEERQQVPLQRAR